MLFWYLLLNLFNSPAQPEQKRVEVVNCFLLQLEKDYSDHNSWIAGVRVAEQTAEPFVLGECRSQGLVISLLVTVRTHLQLP